MDCLSNRQSSTKSSHNLPYLSQPFQGKLIKSYQTAELDLFATSVYYAFHLLIEDLPPTSDGSHLSELLDLNIPPDRG
jgi:hypothetical protein